MAGTPPMDPAIKAQWVADLRSGEFTQARRALSKDAGHCCLGVLCEQAVKAGVVRKREKPRSTIGAVDYYDPAQPGDSSCSSLPRAVQKWAGLTGPDAVDPDVLMDQGFTRPLSTLNDINELTFVQIADLIEKHL